MSTDTMNHRRHIPRMAGTIERPRLLDRLARNIQHRLTVIVAPPGYGKTTLVAQYTIQITGPVAWQRLTRRDRDIPNLYHQTLAALRVVVPSIPSHPFVRNTPPEVLARRITDDLHEHITGDMVYVIDDVHHLVGSPAAEAWLQTLIDQLPQQCQLILVGQMLPRLSITALVARNELVTIGQQELAFTAEEIQQFAAACGPADYVLDRTAHLAGWPAGVALTCRPLPASIPDSLVADHPSPETLFDTLAQSLLDQQPFYIRDFLLVSATLTDLTPAHCLQILQLQHPEYLDDLYRRQLFIAQTDQGFVYHDLFRDFLQRQLKQTDWPRFQALHQQAATWFAEHHHWEAAVAHWLAADCGDQAAANIERIAQAYATQGKVETLLQWEDQLQALDIYPPRLLYVNAGIHSQRYDYATAAAKLAAATAGFQARHDTAGLIDVRLRTAMLQRLQGHYDAAIQAATQLIDELAALPTLVGKWGVALNIRGTANLQHGDASAALPDLEAALPVYREYSDAHAQAALLQNLEIAYMAQGDFVRVNDCLHELINLQRSLGKSGGLALALNNLGYYYHQLGDYAPAQTTLEEGLTIAQQTHSRRAAGYLHWSLGDLLRDLNQSEAAITHYEHVLDLSQNQDPALQCAVFNSLAMLYRWQQQLDAAHQFAQKAQKLAEHHQLTLESAQAQASMLIIRAYRGESATAVRQFDQLIAQLNPEQHPIEQIQLLGQHAIIALLGNQLQAAYQALATAHQLAQKHHLFHPLAVEAVHTPDLRRLIQRFGRRWTALETQLQHLATAQAPHQAALPKTPARGPTTYNLRVYTLGQERTERDGEPLQAADWETAISRQLFLYLLFHGPDTRERISVAFWPDHAPPSARSNFHTQLFRARKKLGSNMIVFENDRYQINPDVDIWCDVHAFASLVQQAQLGSPQSLYTRDLWQAAVNLYQGEFLPSLHTDWVLAQRQHLADQYLDALLGLSNCAYCHNEFDRALQLLDQARQVDPFREDVHRFMMKCYAAQGEPARVVNHFHQLQQLLEHELATTPSVETQSLFNHLT